MRASKKAGRNAGDRVEADAATTGEGFPTEEGTVPLGAGMWRASAFLAALAVVIVALALARQNARAGRPDEVDVFVVLHDAGDTFALLGPLREVAAHLRVLVLPIGQPATDAVLCLGSHASPGCTPLPAATLPGLGLREEIADGTAGREQMLSFRAIERVTERVAACLTITGMTYRSQLQLALAVRRASRATFPAARFVSFYDSLRAIGSDSDIGADLQRSFVAQADALWVASRLLCPDASRGAAGDRARKCRVVGHSTLEAWAHSSRDVFTLSAVRAKLYGEQAADDGSPSLVWLGGYGRGYREALVAWCQAVRHLRALDGGSAWKFALASHPGAAGHADLDRRVLEDAGVATYVVVVPRAISGMMAALASNLTASHGSTGGVQSVFAGKPALFLDPGAAFNNSASLGALIGLVAETASADEAVRAVVSAAAVGWRVESSRLSGAAVPANSTGAILREIRRSRQACRVAA